MPLSPSTGPATVAQSSPESLVNGKMRPSQTLSKEDCLEMFRQLYLARYFDVRLIKEKKRGRLRGTL